MAALSINWRVASAARQRDGRGELLHPIMPSNESQVPTGAAQTEPGGERLALQAHRLSLATNAVLAVIKLVAGFLVG